MCNFYGYIVSKAQFIRLKQIEKEFGTLAAMDALHDGFKYAKREVLVKGANNNEFNVEAMHWEFIPPWIQDEAQLKLERRKGIPWLDAKAENLLTSRMWKPAAIERRCLVPMTHFYEWRHFQPASEKKPVKYPHVISMKEKEYFFAAGIWTPWTDKSTGETINTFAIVTTEANPLMAQIHNDKKRMPTILDDNLAFEWMMGDLTERRIMEIAMHQAPAGEMAYYTIAKDFKKLANPLEPVVYDELPAIVENW